MSLQNLFLVSVIGNAPGDVPRTVVSVVIFV